MRIDGAIAGLPAMTIRALMRKLGIWEGDQYTTTQIATMLKISPTEGERVVRELAALGFLEPVENRWRKTMKGNALAMATAAAPIARAKAESLLQQFLARVAAVNGNDQLAYRVTRVIVFGSYLDKARAQINDIDLGVTLEPRHADQERQNKLCSQRVREAHANGKRLAGTLAVVFWPKDEVVRLLKSRVRGLSLHTDGEDITGFPHEVLL